MTRRITNFLAPVALVLVTAGALPAQSKWAVPEEMRALPSFIKVPVFPTDLKEDPSLPRVLIIGDSISMYYTAEVRHLLAGKANVFRIPDNGKNTGYALRNIDYWLGDGHWAVIHFNGSSAEFVGRFWLRQAARPVIGRDFGGFEGVKTMVFSDPQF